MKIFNLEINKTDLRSVLVNNRLVSIEGIQVDTFSFPESMDCDDVATILSKEDDSDLHDILTCLKHQLEKQNIKFTFTLKHVKNIN